MAAIEFRSRRLPKNSASARRIEGYLSAGGRPSIRLTYYLTYRIGVYRVAKQATQDDR